MKKSDVVKFFRTQTDAAKFLRISHVAVSQWPAIIPEQRASRLAARLKGEVRNGIALQYDPLVYEKIKRRKTGNLTNSSKFARRLDNSRRRKA